MIFVFWEAARKNSQQLAERLEKTVAGSGIEICSGTSKILVNSIRPRPSTNVWMNHVMNGKVLEKVVDQFKYLGSTQSKDRTSVKEAKIRLTGFI